MDNETTATSSPTTPTNPRVKLALDVIAHIETGRFHAYRGLMFGEFAIPDDNGETHVTPKDDRDDDVPARTGTIGELKADMATWPAGAECGVCAAGALLVAYMMETYPRASRVAPSWIDVRRQLSTDNDIFTEEQLELIEVAYEMGQGVVKVEFESTDEHRSALYHAADWEPGIEQPRERLLAIMHNIIAHDGLFVP